MATGDQVFAGSIPALYDRYLVPLLFEPYATDLAERLADLTSGRLLETAAGTGAVTRALARSLPDSVAIVATDLNQAMLGLAATRPIARAVTWQQADAASLPFDDGSFDAVVCQFGAMFFPDKTVAFREARRVLKPGGRFLLSVWDRIEANEFAHVVSDAVATLFPDDPPRFLARTPYGHHDTVAIRDALGEAGFERVTALTVERRAHAPSPREPAAGFCLGSPLRDEIEARDPARLDEATVAAAGALAARFGLGPISGRMRAHLLSAA